MEIGSIYDIDIKDLFKERKKEVLFPFEKKAKYKNKKFFNTGRSAIEYLLKYQLDFKPNDIILVPNFTCSSIIEAIERAKIKYIYYNISSSFNIDMKDLKNKLCDNVKAIFFINYFGSTQSKEIIEELVKLKEKYIIIEDNTQALFTSDENKIGIGDYIVASIRKWLPIPDGAILCSEHTIKDESIDNGYNEYMVKYILAQLMKNEYLKYGKQNKEKYLELVKQSIDSLFSDYTIRKMTDISLKLMENQNFEDIAKKRKENYKFLYENLEEIEPIEIPFKPNIKIVPFGFVILTKYRDELNKYCIENDVYCNIHWKGCANELSDRIITIPCDQRYTKKDMEYIADLLKSFFRRKK